MLSAHEMEKQNTAIGVIVFWEALDKLHTPKGRTNGSRAR